VGDKDLFHAFYRRALSRRLLSHRSDDDSERAMLARFRLECGPLFTGKLDGMLNDLGLSAAIRGDFLRGAQPAAAAAAAAAVAAESEGGGVVASMDVLVLNALHWPLTRGDGDSVRLPPDMSGALTSFDRYAGPPS
jgi:hypothetical protein